MDEELARYTRILGSTLCGKWRLENLIGVGGAAAVYSAVHRNGKRVAVKVLHRELCADEDFVSRFVQEGYVANEISHPGVVSVLDDDRTADGQVFLVMELLEGASLASHIERSAAGFAPTVALAILDEILDVLRAAHKKNIVHRDVKPDNIFIVRHDAQQVSIKLLDFGIAQFRDNPNRKNPTSMGARMGTPAYMPPEQARGNIDQIDGRADLFSVGVTLLEMLTKRALHDAGTVNEKLLLAMTSPAPPGRTLFPLGTAELWSLLDRSLAFDRHARFADAEAMQAAVREASKVLGSVKALPGGTLLFAEGALPQLPIAVPVTLNVTPGGSPSKVATPDSLRLGVATPGSGSGSQPPVRTIALALEPTPVSITPTPIDPSSSFVVPQISKIWKLLAMGLALLSIVLLALILRVLGSSRDQPTPVTEPPRASTKVVPSSSPSSEIPVASDPSTTVAIASSVPVGPATTARPSVKRPKGDSDPLAGPRK
jgi:serine/threonine protein kinase